jgi:hypothetical protein
MYRLTWYDPQAFSGGEAFASEQALSAPRTAAGDLECIGEHRVTSEISNVQARIGGFGLGRSGTVELA